jgi:hypothetical protein
VTSRDPPSRSSFKVVMTEEFERNISKGKKNHSNCFQTYF